MAVDRALAEHELRGDRLIRRAGGDQAENLELARSQSVRAGTPLRTGSAKLRAYASR